MRTQVDNRSLTDKCAVRREIVKLLGGAPLRVLDLFSGEGLIWAKLGQEFKIERYTPVDIRPRQRGTIRLEVTGRTVQAFDPNRYNVIDIDSYGDPWEVWNGLADRVRGTLAVFFTHGVMGRSSTSLSNFLKEAAGIPLNWSIPTNDELLRLVARDFLARSLAAFQVERALYIEHRRGGGFGKAHKASVDYYGFLLRGRV